MKLAGLFPGQGSQQVGMGKTFFENNQTARALYELADKTLGFSISTLSFNGPIETLTLTQNAQPAILVSSYASYLTAAVNLDVAAGHSLGEYTALVAAKSISFEDAVSLVYKRGRYMQEAVPQGVGSMVAVMGPSEDEIRLICESVSGICEIANLNCPGQTVVAGAKASVDEFSIKMAEKGGKIIPLNVSAPFHCSLMKPAADNLAKDLDAITFEDPAFPVYANVTAKPVTAGADARELLKRQVCGSVRWTDSVKEMVKDGVTSMVEFGPGAVLSKLVKRIDATPKRVEIGVFTDLEKLSTLS